MPSPTPTQESTTIRELLGKRLEELELTEEALAEAARVPTEYISDLIAGRRRAPHPGRTDVYGLMTSFLRLGRNDLVTCAQAERLALAPKKPPMPKLKVRRMLMEMCDPAVAEKLEARRAKNGNAELNGFLERLLHLTQSAVARVLADQATLRVAAERSGRTYAAARLTVLEFLDATPDTLTPKDVTTFFLPRVAKWDVDLDAGVLRVVMQAHDRNDGPRRWASG